MFRLYITSLHYLRYTYNLTITMFNAYQELYHETFIYTEIGLECQSLGRGVQTKSLGSLHLSGNQFKQ